MSDNFTQRLYELSVSLTPTDTLESTAAGIATEYLNALPCEIAVVFESIPDNTEPIQPLATSTRSEEISPEQFRNGVQSLLEDDTVSFPLKQDVAENNCYLLDLPDFGVLALGATGELPETLVAALADVNEQAAAICRDKRQQERCHTERTRQTLDGLYTESEKILVADDRETVCKQAIDAVTELTDFSLAGVHLYDRSLESLTPVATTAETETIFEDGPNEYTDRDSVVWRVYHEGEPATIDNTGQFSGSLPDDRTPAKSALILPLGDHGVFIVSAVETNAFDSSEIALLHLFSRIIAVALDRAERIKRLQGIQEITRAIVAAESHEDVAMETLDQIPALLDLPLTTIWEYDPTAELLRPIASTPAVRELVGELPSFGASESIIWNAFQEGETHLVSNLDRRPDAYNAESSFDSELIVPIGDFGVLATGSTHVKSFTESDRRLVETLAANVETAMRLVDRREEFDLLDQVLARILRHNIRNELNVIQGYASKISNEIGAEHEEMATRIIDSSRSIETTAENAREMQEIVNTRDARATVDLAETVEEAVSMVTAEFPDVRIEVTAGERTQILSHPALVTAIRHLVENSVKHHDGPTESVRIEIATTVENGDPVVEISDNGPGIPQAEIDTLDRHGESALEHGSGAGLWLVDRVVEYSGGSVSFDTTGNGTVVRLLFKSGPAE